MAAFKERAIAQIRAQVGKGKVICGLSGGVDSRSWPCCCTRRSATSCSACSSTTACCAARGRAGRAPVPRPLQHPAGPCRRLGAFLKALAGVTDPETKRKTIGAVHRRVREAEAKKIGGAQFLAQGTLYPDVIESVSSPAGRRSPSRATTMSAACRRA
jgi:GMP synthase, PP-ATPase domain/subunit